MDIFDKVQALPPDVALYKACANWAMAESYSVLNDVPTSNRWVHTLNKCREKSEAYK